MEALNRVLAESRISKRMGAPACMHVGVSRGLRDLLTDAMNAVLQLAVAIGLLRVGGDGGRARPGRVELQRCQHKQA
jgi:hypothetical protein